jgi:hypothetical protein
MHRWQNLIYGDEPPSDEEIAAYDQLGFRPGTKRTIARMAHSADPPRQTIRVTAEVADALVDHFMPGILRAVVGGVPDWYKAQLNDNALRAVANDNVEQPAAVAA